MFKSGHLNFYFAVPGAPVDVISFPSAPGEIAVHWKPPIEINGVLTGYVLNLFQMDEQVRTPRISTRLCYSGKVSLQNFPLLE